MCNTFIILEVKFANTENDPQYAIFTGLIISVCGAVDEEDLSWWHFYISVVLTVLTGWVASKYSQHCHAAKQVRNTVQAILFISLMLFQINAKHVQ